MREFRTMIGIMILSIMILAPGRTALGREAGGIPGGTDDDPGKKISLSLRISEAKNRKTGRTYFRSLLRQRKRKQGAVMEGIPVSIPSRLRK